MRIRGKGSKELKHLRSSYIEAACGAGGGRKWSEARFRGFEQRTFLCSVYCKWCRFPSWFSLEASFTELIAAWTLALFHVCSRILILIRQTACRPSMLFTPTLLGFSSVYATSHFASWFFINHSTVLFKLYNCLILHLFEKFSSPLHRESSIIGFRVLFVHILSVELSLFAQDARFKRHFRHANGHGDRNTFAMTPLNSLSSQSGFIPFCP